MSMTAAPAGFDAAGFESFLQSQDLPGWMVDQRRQAFASASDMDWPHRKHEEWIRTDIRAFQLDKFSPSTDPSSFSEVQRTHQLIDDVELGGHIETVNSHVVSSRLDDALAERGVVLMPLGEAASAHEGLVREHLHTAFEPKYDKFAALHTAFAAGGQFVYVPRNVVLDKPLHLGSILTDGGVDTTHTLIVVEEGAEATILHESNSTDPSASGLHLGGVEIIQRPGSHLRYVNLQEWGHKTYHFAHQKAVLDRDATLQWTIAAMGSMLSKVNQSVELVGKNAESQVNGVMFTEGRQHLAYHTLQHHRAESCRSDFLYKAAQQDRSRTVWRGMIKVDKAAQKTDGYQRNDNLVLSNNSRADSIPGLEIEADDVRCTHGSTTAKVDEEQIFYARCRGYTRKEAVRMIVTGFFQQIFDRITIDSVRDALGAAIARQVREYE